MRLLVPETAVFGDPLGRMLFLSALIVWLVLVVPATIGLKRACEHRFEYLRGILPDEALKLYREQWFPSVSEANTTQHFRGLYLVTCRRRHWGAALAFALLLALALLFLVHAAWASIYERQGLSPVYASALAGGVAWVFFDQLARIRRRDFTADDVASHILRLVISMPLGVALTAIMKDEGAVPVAFLLGAFPTNALFKYARRVADRRLQLGDTPSTEAAFQLEVLQGVGRPQAERYAEEGIQSVLQLAYSDPIDATVRTNYELDYVTDCVSQALLWTYTADKLHEVQMLGLRGAVEAYNLREQLASSDSAEQQIAEENLREIAKALGVTESTAQRILYEVANDPYAQFICNVWSLR